MSGDGAFHGRADSASHGRGDSASRGRGDSATQHLLDRIRSDRLVTRRDYLRLLVTVSGGLLAGTVAVAAGLFRRHPEDAGVPPLRIAEAIRPGESVTFSYPGEDDPSIAIGLRDGSVVAYSSVCTHLACAVLWIRERGELMCPCHDGVFDPRTGAVTAGPPPRPLPRILVEQRPDGVWAVGVGR